MVKELCINEALQGIEPKILWEFFSAISAIPHGSGNERHLSGYILEWARSNGFTVRQDTAGNICLHVPSTAGYESSAVVTLQAHLDMVCEKDESVCFDFSTDGIRLLRDGNFIRAAGTTLGADNGIGLSAALAVAAAPDITHGPLELLLTVQEETGLTGAMALDPTLISGRMLLNLDSERTGTLCIGCAGGCRVCISLPLSPEQIPDGYAACMVRVSGLRGGHSGLDIHKNRGNAVKLLSLALDELHELGIMLGSITGGDRHNVIPREASALICCPISRAQSLQRQIEAISGKLAVTCMQEPELSICFHDEELPLRAISSAGFSRILQLLLALPSGVLELSSAMPGQVETSCNLASVAVADTALEIQLMPRSSSLHKIGLVTRQIGAIAGLAGALCRSDTPYPGWAPDLQSPLLDCVESVHAELFGRSPVRESTHAGLECGILGAKCPGIQMISIGPDIYDCHSPSERVAIDSVERFWRLLCGVLERIANNTLS